MELCLEAIKTYTYLTYTPKELQTTDFYLRAIQNNVKCMDNIPDDKITEEMLECALKMGVIHRYSLHKASEDYCLAAYKINNRYTNYM